MNRTARALLVGLSALALTAGLAAQQGPPAAAQGTGGSVPFAQRKFLAAGPFLFPPGASRPTYMDAFGARPAVRSPDGKAQVTVTGPPESLKAFVTLEFLGRYTRGLAYRVWPIERDVDVLWRPDSQAFALTDNRYANLSYVLVCGTRFGMGESGAGLGIPITDLTPAVRQAFRAQVQRYYAPRKYETRLFYAKALRWTRGDQLLVGVSAMIAGAPALPNRGVKEWNLAFLVDVPGKRVVRVLSEARLLSRYGIAVAK